LSGAATLAKISDRLVEHFRGQGDVELPALRPTPWFDRALVPMLAACAGGPPCAGFANLRNTGRAIAPSLPAEAVVETATSIAGGALAPRPWGQPPPEVARFLQQAALAEALAFAAARTQSPSLVRRALETLPLDLPRAALDGLVACAVAPIVEP
jgi:alpha-galactosidase/6-phospho-beta-glucosidase family protein